MAVQKVPIIICGAGSAGLCAATFMASAGISADNIKILERNAGPMKIGQADGVQCRTVEVYESFGLSEQLLKECYHVLEVCFWAEKEDSASTTKQLVRTRRTADTMPGLSHHPHAILNQARMHEMLLGKMHDEAGMTVEYEWHVTNVWVDFEGDSEFPCVVVARKGQDGPETTMRAKYVLASDPLIHKDCLPRMR